MIVGLGNPGRHYQHNRHNIGFRCIDHLASSHNVSMKKPACQSDTGRLILEGADALLVKPRTFVNLSGGAVACLLRKHRLSIASLIVIYDDLDLPTGRIRLRTGGSAGGHRGVRSIIERTGSQDFQRVRIGISRPYSSRAEVDEDDIVEYVLGDFPAAEEEMISQAVERAAEAVLCILHQGMETAMNKFNRRR